MSKQYNIKWRGSDYAEIKRVVKNFNAKVSRLKKKNPSQANAYPEKVTFNEIVGLIHTRNDFKRELDRLKRFSRKGSEELVTLPDNKYNLVTTIWQKKEMQYMARRVNNARDKRRDFVGSIEMMDRGKGLGYTIAEYYNQSNVRMGDVDDRSLDPINAFTWDQSRADLKKKFRTLRKEAQEEYWIKREELLRDNYIEAIEQNFPRNSRELIDYLKKMSGAEFYAKFKAVDPNFEGVYYASDEEYEAALAKLKADWMPVKEEPKPEETEEQELSKDNKKKKKKSKKKK